MGDERFPRVFDRLVYADGPKGDLDNLQAFKHLKAVSLMGERPAEAFTSLSKIKTLEAIDAGILNQELKWESPPDRMPDPGPNDQVDRQLANSLPALAQLPKLRIFRATGMEIGLRAIKAIVQFPRLEVLSLSQSRITNEGLASLGECKTLRELDIDETGVNDSGLKHLRLIPNLQILDLRGCPLTDAACEPLGTLATLRSLNLNETGIRGSGLQALASLPELETLSLPFGVDRAAAADLQHRLPSLKIKIGDENFAGDEQ